VRGSDSGDHAPVMVGGFRHRGHRHVARIESFSDAVFGLSVTLLIVSLEVPKTFDDLLRALAGFPAFALTFVLLAQIWFIQYRFFRRYSLQDNTTIALNMALLFVVVFFTYPLKFLFGVAVARNVSDTIIRGDQLVWMYAIYDAGYAAVFVIFILLFGHALRKRAELELTPFEVFETRRVIALFVFQILVAAVSVSLAAFFNVRRDYEAVGRAGGLAYLLIPIGITAIEAIFGRRRRALEKRGAFGAVTS